MTCRRARTSAAMTIRTGIACAYDDTIVWSVRSQSIDPFALYEYTGADRTSIEGKVRSELVGTDQ